jgi:hypothetical protein
MAFENVPSLDESYSHTVGTVVFVISSSSQDPHWDIGKAKQVFMSQGL